ncbi:MAG: hypothetical protein ACRBN8_47065 [Nannocystales bacterium]
MMKPPFDWHAAALDVPPQRRRVGNLKRGWCRDRTENTILARHYDLRVFAAFVLGAELAPPTETAHTHAALVVLGILRKGSAYAQSVVLQFIQTHPGRDASVIRCVSTLRSWARHLHAKREVTCSLDGMPTPKVAALRRRSSARSEDLTREGLDSAQPNPATRTRALRFLIARDAALAEVSAHSTLKQAQLQRLRWRDIEFGEDPEFLTSARVQVPARDGRLLPHHLPPHATAALKRWRGLYIRQFGVASNGAVVFPDPHGQPMRPLGLDEIMERLRAG